MSTTPAALEREQKDTATANPPGPRAQEQSRARYPDEEGFIERDGVKVFWESYGARRTDDPLPANVDPRALPGVEGADPVLRAPLSGYRASTRAGTAAPTAPRSHRPTTRASSPRTRSTSWTLAGVDHAICVAFSSGTQRGLLLAAEHPDRVAGMVFIGSYAPVESARRSPTRVAAHPRVVPLASKRPPITTRGWGKFNFAYWRR